MGDLVTLLVLSLCGDVLIRFQGTIFNDILLIVLIALIPYWCYLALKNKVKKLRFFFFKSIKLYIIVYKNKNF